MKKSFTLNENFLSSQNSANKQLCEDLMNSGITLNEFQNYQNKHSDFSSQEVALPGKKVLSNILGYSQALFVVKTKNAGIFSILMN
jgi:hypothetical protein